MTDTASAKDRALSSDELDHVVGGIIIVSGLPQLSRQFTSAFDRVALNPQPLPPRSFTRPLTADTPSRQGASHSRYLNSIQPSQHSARGGTGKVAAGPFCAATTAIRPETRATVGHRSAHVFLARCKPADANSLAGSLPRAGSDQR